MQETTKERQKRLQLTKAEQSTRGSKHYAFTPCNGTLVNAGFDEDKKQIQKQINYRVNKAERPISSTKLGNQSNTPFLKQPHRTNRYQPQMLTIVMIMNMTKKQRVGIEIDRYYAFRAK